MSRKTSILLSLGVSAVLIAACVWLLYHYGLGSWHENGWIIDRHGMGVRMMGGGMGIVTLIFWIVLIAALVMLISGAITGTRSSKQHPVDSQAPLDILKQRYARGEIDKMEYEEKRRELIA